MELPKIISVDDHVIEPPHVWSTWLPKKYASSGPRVVRKGVASVSLGGGTIYEETFDDDNGTPADCWVYEDLISSHKRVMAACGLERDDMTLGPITYEEMLPGCYDPKERLKDMDRGWVEASLCFPTFPRFCGQTFAEAKDKDLALACVRAYNDWMVEEWTAGSSGRLIPLCLIPLWDVAEAAREVKRNASRGVHAVAFSEIPSFLGLPSVHSGYWDPFFASCAANNVVVCMHVGSSSRAPATSADAPPAVQGLLSFNNSMASLADFLFSGVLVRFPDLTLAYSEGQIGWLPYALERADVVWKEHVGWSGVKGAIPEPPSVYYRNQIYGCFFRDAHGVRSLDEIGVDTVTFETDYPHSDSTWPDTKKIAEEMFAGLSDEVIYKITRGNAIRMLSLDIV